MFSKPMMVGLALTLAVVPLLVLSGCNQSADQSASDAKVALEKRAKGEAHKDGAAKKKDDEHGHKPGAHGGIIVEIGRDNYHAEAVFEKGGLLKLYTLGKDEAQIIDVEKQVIEAYVKEESAIDSVKIELNPVPRTGDKEGRTSQFVGKLPQELAGKAVVVTVQMIVIDGVRYRIGFASTPPKHDEGMPIGANPQDEKNLYLKPGGIYTEADIKANGNMTASQKFKDFKPRHDLKPKPGEKICPITLTKANAQCTWIVAGKTYEFCCPPCVYEFVSQAKDPQQAKDIKEPAYYVKKK
ncbi:MAG: hypothetical protein HYX68_14855 [Planctomycetes bacterium]|nr:hypothetical protein [Planctomycetota bacterium]